MPRYYTRACNFYYGNISKNLVKKKKSIPLNGNNLISFDHIELISRKSKKKISINKLSSLPKLVKKNIFLDLKKITTKKKNFSNLNFLNLPNVMGVLNLTPDSFSDGGKFNSKSKGVKHAIQMFKAGANIIDIGGESTRPGFEKVPVEDELSRVIPVIEAIRDAGLSIPISVDTMKATVAEQALRKGANMINDVSGMDFDKDMVSVIKKRLELTQMP